MSWRCLAATVFVLFFFSEFASIGTAGQSDTEKPDPDKALFLVARTELPDPFFKESVVLMLPVSEGGLLVGLIVNKPTQFPLHKIFPKDSALKERTDAIYFGGPVDTDSLSAVFRSSKSSKQAIPLFGDLYVSFDLHFIEGMLKKPDETHDMRLFLGRAQWAPDQLQVEMIRGAWYSERAESSWIFKSDPATVWRTLLSRVEPGDIAANIGDARQHKDFVVAF